MVILYTKSRPLSGAGGRRISVLQHGVPQARMQPVAWFTVTPLGVKTVQHQTSPTAGGMIPFQALSLMTTGDIVHKIAENVFTASITPGFAPLKHTRRIFVYWSCR